MILYKKDTNGKLRQLEIITRGDEIHQISGLIDGKFTTRISKCKPKNVGRANETSGVEQAVKEVQSKITKKLKEGYHKTIEDAKNKITILPMLAKVYEDHIHKALKYDGPIFAQPKFDGMRCLAIITNGKVRLISRANNEVETMVHIKDELEAKFVSKDIILDGELYVHGEGFQTNMEYVKKYRKGKSERIQFNVYDIVADVEFETRFYFLVQMFREHDFKNIKLTRTIKIPKENFKHELDIQHRLHLKQGYEGTIVRWGPEPYTYDKRSESILKYKDFIDIDSLVVDVIPYERYPDQGKLVCEIIVDNEPKQFTCDVNCSHEEKVEMLANKQDYIGKKAEVRFFEYTDDGLPRIARCVGFRLDK